MDSTDARASVLAAWVSEWAKALGKPETLRVERTTANVIVTLNADLDDRLRRGAATLQTVLDINKQGLASRLGDQLLTAVTSADPVFALLTRYYPVETGALRTALAHKRPDIGTLRSPLATLARCIEEPMGWLTVALADGVDREAAALRGTGHFDLDELIDLVRVGTRALVIGESPLVLKTWPGRALSEGAVNVIVRDTIESMASDAAFCEKLNARTRVAAAELAELEIDDYVAVASSEPYTYASAWVALRHSIDARHDLGGAARRLTYASVKQLVRRALARPLHGALGGKDTQSKRCFEAMGVLGMALEEWLVSKERVTEGERVLDAIAPAACSDVIAEFIARTTARSMSSERDGSSSLEVRRWLADAVRAAGDDEALRWHVAKRSVLDDLSSILLRDAPQYAAHCRSALTILRDEALSQWGGRTIWRRLREALNEKARSSSSAWRSVRWDRFDRAQFEQALQPLRRGYSTDRVYEVVLPVEGAVPNDTLWRAGRHVWFSPVTWSVGEGIPHSGSSHAVPAYHVWQRVSARSAASAVERARNALEGSLSAMSFALSVAQGAAGYRPSIGRGVFVGEAETGDCTTEFRTPREESADAATLATELTRFGDVYAALLNRVVDGTPPNELESAFVRALFWYRSGRWQRDPVRRLLDHVIALEHLFTEGRSPKDDLVATGLRALHKSWLFRPSPFRHHIRQLIERARALLTLVTNDVELSAVVDGVYGKPEWRVLLKPWLSPGFIQRVKQALSVQQQQPVWDAYLASLVQLRNSEPYRVTSDESRGEDAWFRVRTLLQRRHRIVHEAMTHAPGIDLDADAVTELLEDTLTHLADVLLDRPQTVMSIADVLAGLEPPWTH